MGVIVGQLDGIEGRQQGMWGSGDYAALGARIHPLAERLRETADRTGLSVELMEADADRQR